MPTLLAATLLLLTLSILSRLYKFVNNYYRAHLTALPKILIPYDQNSYIWMIISVPLRPLLKKLLPTPLYNRINLSIYGWEFHVALDPFTHHAAPQGNPKTFFLVSTGKSEISSRDPEVCWAILSRPRDFAVPDVVKLILGRFGANALTSNGEAWQRQRRVVAGVINERISGRVWGESLRLAGGLVGEVVSSGGGGTEGVFGMMKKVTILVLAGAGMGEGVEWDEEAPEGGAGGHRMSYMEACKAVIEATAGPIILPKWVLNNYPAFLPGAALLRNLGVAIEEFPVHTREMIAKERARASVEGGGAKSNIMSQLAQATAGEGKGKGSLSEEEMLGNLYVVTAAGFDTTANTLSYALVLLCRYPAWQAWMCEEIDNLIPEDAGDEELDYAKVFPKVVRILAVMLETLRIFVPVIHIAREAKAKQTITTCSGTLEIPAGCTTYVDIVALHLDPELWRDLNKTEEDEGKGSSSFRGEREDEYAFRPSRWVNPAGSSQALFQPPRGAYVPWSGGPRVCPGQKMAQVEFTAILLRLFRRHRLEAVPLEGETRDGLEERLDALMKDSISILTLQMQGVYDMEEGKGTKLKLVRRK